MLFKGLTPFNCAIYCDHNPYNYGLRKTVAILIFLNGIISDLIRQIKRLVLKLCQRNIS